MSASDVELARRYLSARARKQLALVDSEMARVTCRLEALGTRAQRAQWAQQINDIDHDRVSLRAGLNQSERVPLEVWVEEHGILPSVIDMLALIVEQVTIEIDGSLGLEPGTPRGAALELYACR